MGQTLTHGVYLPDEGERNCYNGLAANWSILDNSVGTIAEHTTALAGKAPAVHTHTKSDVTDLFNSANVWSALNSYSNGQIRIKSQNQEIGVTPSSSVIQYLEFADKNDAQHGIVGLWDYANGASEIQMYIADKFENGAKDPTGTSDSTFLSFGFKADGSKFLAFAGQVDNSVIPKSNSTYNLGTSAYIWDNVYANTVLASSVRAQGTSNALILAAMETWEDGARIFMYGKDNVNGSTIYADIDHNDGIHSKTGVTLNINGFYPSGVSRHLGLADANNKWLTFNGINPGALSLPDTLGTSGTENVNYFNVIGYLNNTGTLATIPAAATYDGWLYINAKDGADSYIIIDDSPASFGTSVFGNNGLGSQSIGLLCLMCPIRKGHAYNVRIKSAGIVSARIYPAQGNV